MGRDKDLIALFVAEFSAWIDVPYSLTACPDVVVKDRKAIDAIAEDGNGGVLAIEHTLLQPFTGGRHDRVRFLKTAACLDQRQDLAEPHWMIDLIFNVGGIPSGVDWKGPLGGSRIGSWRLDQPLRPDDRSTKSISWRSR